jgi:3',5'-cyclic AMP phosphodiesterase CpdA
MALEVLGTLPDVPLVTTPGKHDVPLYRFWERLTDPFRNWRRFVSEELNTVTRVPGATFVALSSAAPRRAIVNGRGDDAQMDFATEAVEAAPAADLRCLVIHHHFVAVADGQGGRPLPRAEALLERIEAAGVDVVFGGHVHQVHLTTSRDVLRGRKRSGVPLLACGTTTSRRGRGAEAGWNSLNVARLSPSRVEVTPYLQAPRATDFERGEARVFPRAGAGAGDAVEIGDRGR